MTRKRQASHQAFDADPDELRSRFESLTTESRAAAERLAVRDRQQAVIARLGLQAMTEPDLHGFMSETLLEVQAALDGDICAIFELQPGRRTLFLRVGAGWRDGIAGSAHVKAGRQSPAGVALTSKRPLLIKDADSDTRFTLPRWISDHDVRSGLSCVIRQGAGEYGVIEVYTRQPRAFTPEDANFLQAAATVVGSAVNRHQTRTRLAVERGVALAIAESREVNTAAVRILECFAEVMDTSIGELWWADDEGRALHRRVITAHPPHDREQVSARMGRPTFEPGQGLVGRVFANAQGAWITEFKSRAEFVRLDAAKALGLVTGLAFPVVSAGEVLGVITLFSQRRMIADDIVLRSFEALGRSIGEAFVRMNVEAKALRLAAITASSDDAILTYDFDGQITEWLGGAERLYGHSAEEMIGQSVERLVPEECRSDLWAVCARIQRDEIVDPLDTRRVARDGRVIEVSVRTSPVRDLNGVVTGVSSIDRDDSRNKHAERQLVEAARQKDEFLAMLGHELRNPLAAVQHAAEVLRLSPTNAMTVIETQQVLERQSRHMATLLDGLLDVSRIIRGQVFLQRTPVDLAEICREVAADLVERVSARRLGIQVSVPSSPVWIDGDRVRVAQIIDNLLSNAQKFTSDDGSVSLTLTPSEGMAEIAIRDSGIGIAPGLLPHVFEVFRQARQPLDRTHGGLGLGLALVKALVEMHDGTVDARSEGAGQGSEFVVRLPTTQKRAEPRAAPKPAPPAMHILLVEDNRDVARVLRRMLEGLGHEVRLAETADQALAVARTLKPDVMLCDLGLPGGKTGYDVARAIRADPETRSIGLVAISGYSRPADRRLSVEAGFDGHIAKPADLATIGAALSAFPVSPDAPPARPDPD